MNILTQLPEPVDLKALAEYAGPKAEAVLAELKAAGGGPDPQMAYRKFRSLCLDGQFDSKSKHQKRRSRSKAPATERRIDRPLLRRHREIVRKLGVRILEERVAAEFRSADLAMERCAR